MDRKDIKNWTIQDIEKEMVKLLIPSYRAEQLFYWIYKIGISDFDSIPNLPKGLKQKLNSIYYIGNIELVRHLKSTDSTEKFLFRLSDGYFIETVLIKSGNRKTVCLSTQVGCKYGCVFCASGSAGFKRNLTTSEILNQILFLKHKFGYPLTNFVFMGMGEPLDNYENLTNALMIMNSPQGMGIGARRITISTCGIVPGIEKLKELDMQVNLSISLHSVDNKVRDFLMPINKLYPLKEVISVCEDFIKKTGRRLTIEYILLKGENDSLEDVKGLSFLAKKLKASVNLIPYSPVSNRNIKALSLQDFRLFKNRLIKDNINVTVRDSKGKDIQAGCGQLMFKMSL